MEDRQEQAGVNCSAEVVLIVRLWMLIRWAQMRAEKEGRVMKGNLATFICRERSMMLTLEEFLC